MPKSRLIRAAEFFGLLLKSDFELLTSPHVPGSFARRTVIAKYVGVLRALRRGGSQPGSVTIGDRQFHYDSLSSLTLLQNTFTEDDYLAGIVPPGCSVVDVGANVGQFRLFSEVVLGASRVQCFEPVARTFEALSRNFRSDIHRFGIGNGSELVLHVDDSVSTRASFQSRLGIERTEVVPVRRLDDIEEVRSSPVDLLKIDTEGTELDVLRSGVETVRRCAFLFAELSLARPSTGNMTDVLLFLRQEAPDLDLIHVGHTFFDENGMATAVDCLFANTSRVTRPAQLGDHWKIVSDRGGKV
ncbi:MAG: FkbM family methyltransferase [Pirellulaceae bacterium]|nr:FkbM family methyltransferase [Pirellulaceae bacterium]